MHAIRDQTATDAPLMAKSFADQNWEKGEAQFRGYFEESQAGARDVLLAEDDHGLAGYVTILWESGYPPFRDAHVPEIADFNVLPRCRRRGIGTALLDEAERRIAARSSVAGIGVGVSPGFGAAQIMYVRRGYVPDGRGLWQNGRYLEHGDQVMIRDDDMALYFTMPLPGSSAGP